MTSVSRNRAIGSYEGYSRASKRVPASVGHFAAMFAVTCWPLATEHLLSACGQLALDHHRLLSLLAVVTFVWFQANSVAWQRSRLLPAAPEIQLGHRRSLVAFFLQHT